MFQKVTLALYSLKDTAYIKPLLFFTLHLEYLKQYHPDIFNFIISNPQSFNECICETSLSFLSSQIEKHPQNANIITTQKLWSTIPNDRKKSNRLKKFVRDKTYQHKIDCESDTEILTLLIDGTELFKVLSLLFLLRYLKSFLYLTLK